MRVLKFEVSGQSLKKNGDFGGIIAGSTNYLQCRFATSDPDWLKCKKAAVFNDTYACALDAAMSCAVPDEVTDGKSFKVQLVGQHGATRIVTNNLLIEQV